MNAGWKWLRDKFTAELNRADDNAKKMTDRLSTTESLWHDLQWSAPLFESAGRARVLREVLAEMDAVEEYIARGRAHANDAADWDAWNERPVERLRSFLTHRALRSRSYATSRSTSVLANVCEDVEDNEWKRMVESTDYVVDEVAR